MVYFRGMTYEFGDNVNLQEGGIGRTDTLSCPIAIYTNTGSSTCTASQATELAKWYHTNPDHTYDFFLDNCHHFAEWLINRLLNNECTDPE